MKITLNRAKRWKDSAFGGLEIDGHKLRGLKNEAHMADVAFLITNAVDSFEQNYVWDKVSVDWDYGINTSCEISYYCSNTKKVEIGGIFVDFDDWIRDNKTKQTEKAKLSEHLFTPVKAWDGNALLGCEGRFLWIRFDIAAQNRAEIELRSIKLNMQAEHIIDYLPEVYRKGLKKTDFFYRYMAVFDDIFYTIEDDIKDIGKKLDFRTAQDDMLSYLVKWLGIDSKSISGDALRTKIASAVEEFGFIGTKFALEKAVEAQSGYKPIIIEHFQVAKMIYEGKGRQTYKNLFGTNPYSVYVLLPEDAVSEQEKISELMTKMQSCVPANVVCEPVPLRSNIKLDYHTYLGINSKLSDYRGIVVDQQSTLYHEIFIGSENRQ